MRAFRFIFTWVFAPGFFFGYLAAGLEIVRAETALLWLVPLFMSAIVVSFLAEWLVPYEPRWNRTRGDIGRDLLHAFVNEGSNVAGVAALPLLLSVDGMPNVWPSRWPLPLQLTLAIVVADFGTTLAHFASHRLASLWRLHAVHHSVTRLYGFNALMKHPLHLALETFVGTVPLVLLGMPVTIGALLGLAVGLQLLLQHSNVDMRVGPLVYVWAVAPAHRHHHLASKTHGDVNFGLFTSLWDHLLGTFMIARPAPRDGEIGIAGRPRYPVRYLAQLVEPFRRSSPASHD